MPIIKTYRKGGRYIEDFEEFCPPVFSSFDYVDELSETTEKTEEGVNITRMKKHFLFSFLKKWCSFQKFGL